MKSLFLFILISSVYLSCSNGNFETDSKDDILAIDQSHDFSVSDSLTEFYVYYALIVRNPSDSSFGTNCLRLDALWGFLVDKKIETVTYLFSPEAKISRSIYGEKFKKITPSISTLPNKIHSLFLIEALNRQDFLFGKRVLMGNNLFVYLQNPVSVFPIFKTENGLLPEFLNNTSFNQSEIKNVRPDFYNEFYMQFIDSVYSSYERRFMVEKKVVPTDIDWFQYEDKFYDDKYKNANPLPDSLLKVDS
jgi:hypothetical protein